MDFDRAGRVEDKLNDIKIALLIIAGEKCGISDRDFRHCSRVWLREKLGRFESNVYQQEMYEDD